MKFSATWLIGFALVAGCYSSTEERNYRSPVRGPAPSTPQSGNSAPKPSTGGGGNVPTLDGLPPGNPNAGVVYAQIAPLMTASCNGAGCHSAPGAGGIPLDTYDDVVKHFDASIASLSPTAPMKMPIGKPEWTAAELQLLADWKAAELPETAADAPPATPPGAKVGFVAMVQPIMTANCAVAGCHIGAAPTGMVNMETKASVQAAIDRIIARTTANTMPPAGRTPLTADQKKILADWKAGAFAD